MPPELTVLLPVRGAGSYLQPALDSLSAQTCGDWFCLAWDDASADGSGERLLEHARRDHRFQVIRGRAHLGVAEVLGELLRRVETPWFARMDADDLCAPTRFERQLAAARASPRTALWGARVEPAGEASPGWRAYLDWVNSVATAGEIVAQAFTECPLPHPTWLARTDAVRAVGGYRDGPFPEDYDLFLRLLRHGAGFGKVPEVLLAWRDHPARETRTSPRAHRDAFLRLKARHFAAAYPAGELPHLPRRPVAVWGTGKTARILARTLADNGLLPEGFVNPLDGRRETFLGLPVLSPEDSPPGHHLLLVAVGPTHLREVLAQRFAHEGRRFGADYVWMY